MDTNTLRYSVVRNTWYKLSIILNPGTGYKMGSLKVCNNLGKQIFPTVKLPNELFCNNAKIKDKNRMFTFDLLFKTTQAQQIQIHKAELSLKSIRLERTDEKIVRQRISIWGLRRAFDLEFINYYLENLFTDYNNKVFIDRFKSEHDLFKNNSLFDDYVRELNIKTKDSRENKKLRVLYLVNSCIRCEQNNETRRTQELLNRVNEHDCEVLAVTRYGYPFDRDQYPSNLKDKIGNVPYLLMVKGDDNLNTNPLVEYLQKYIVETIKMADNVGAEIIHGTSNFWNGIAAFYAAKYLGIKSIYEVRGFWEETTVENNPDLKDSDVINMRAAMENFVMNKVDHVITISNRLHNQILSRAIPKEKITIIPNGIDSSIFTPDESKKIELQKKMRLDRYDWVVGYVGDNSDQIKSIYETIVAIKKKFNINFVLVVASSSSIKLRDDMIQIKPDGKCYQLFDVSIMPNADNLTTIMAHEIPIISMDNFDGVLNEGNSLLFSSWDELPDKFVRLYNDLDVRAALASNCRDYVLNTIDWGVLAGKQKKLYDQLLE